MSSLSIFSRILCKSLAVALLFNLLLNVPYVLGQGQVDCSRLALNPNDMPEELRKYVIPDKNFKTVESRSESDIPSEILDKVRCGYSSFFLREVKWEETQDGQKSAEGNLESVQIEEAAILMFDGKADVTSTYAKLVEKWQKETSKYASQPTPDPDLPEFVHSTNLEKLDERFGEESAEWICTDTYNSILLYSLFRAPVSSITLTAIFRIQTAVCFLRIGWMDIQQTSLSTTLTTGEAVVAHFAEPISVCNKDLALKTLRDWSNHIERELSGSPPPTEEQLPMKITMTCDSSNKQYESGQPVKLTVRIEQLVGATYDEATNTYKGGKYEAVSNARFALTIKMPDGQEDTFAFGKEQKILTESDGAYTFMPFAPYKTGSYTINASVDPQEYGLKPTKKTGSTDNVKIYSVITITAIEPNIGATEIPYDKIIKLFKDSPLVPSHQDETRYYYKKTRVGPLARYAKEPPNFWWGIYNNEILCRGKGIIFCEELQNGYNCAGYRDKTLTFLNQLRFDRNRAWTSHPLRAIDYGPIVRGEEYYGKVYNEHRAVVLYNYWQKEKWNKQMDNIVLDPWPNQKPEAFTLKQFSRYYTTVGWSELSVYGESEYMKGEPFLLAFPTVGGQVYWNHDLKALGLYYVVDPDIGISHADGIWNPDTPTTAPEVDPTVPRTADAGPGRHVAVTCPVTLDVSNDKGKHVGIMNGKLVIEIEGIELFIYPESETNIAWYLWLPEGKYDIKLTGTGDGDFEVLTSTGEGLRYYNASIKKDQVATLTFDPGNTEEPLTLPNGEKILPKEVTIPDLEVPSPTTSSQSFTTITSWTTVTDVVTSTQHSTMVVSTTVVTSTATNTLLRDTEKPFTVKAATSGGCQFLPVTYNAVAGQRLFGYVTSDKGLNFYLMSKDQFIRYEEAGCGQKVDAHLFIAETTSYTLDWVVPQDGTYYFIFENYGSARNQDVKGTFALYNIRLQTTTLTVYSTFSTEIEYTTTRSFSSVYSTPISQPFPIGDNQMGVIALLLLAVPLGLVFAALRRRASKMPRASATRPVVVPPAPTQFCENCGRQISAGTLYCQSCGDKQGV